MPKELPYISSIKDTPLMFPKIKRTALLLFEGKSDDEIVSLSIENNIYRLEKEKRRRDVARRMIKRLLTIGQLGCIYMLEAELVGGNGKLKVTDVGYNREAKESLKTAQNHFKANNKPINGSINIDNSNFLVHVAGCGYSIRPGGFVRKVSDIVLYKPGGCGV